MAPRDPAAEATGDWQLCCSEVKQRGAALLRAGAWADCTLVLGPQREPLPAHRLLLAMASPVFSAMFYGALAERTVDIPDVQPETFKVLLGYIYSDDVSIGSFSLAWDLYCAAQKYMLPHLVKVCSTYLICNMTPQDACRAYEMALLFDDISLKQEAMQMIMYKTKDVLSSQGFVEADLGTVVHIFSSGTLNIDSELDLFSAAERYAQAQSEINNKENNDVPVKDKLTLPVSSKDNGLTIRSALEEIRFLTLTPKQFSGGPGLSSLLNQNETLALILNISSDDIIKEMPKGFTLSTEKRNTFKMADAEVELIFKRAVVEVQPTCKIAHVESPVLASDQPLDNCMQFVLKSLKNQVKDVLSPPMLVGGLWWRILIEPFRCPNDKKKYLALFLQCHGDGTDSWRCNAQVKLSVLSNTLSEPSTSHTFDRTYSDNAECWGIRRFMEWSEAMDPRYLSSGAITIHARVIVDKKSRVT